MPVGIPKISFLIPEGEDSSWNEVLHQLLLKRYIFLFGNMDDETTNKVVASIIYLNKYDSTLDQLLFINSRGGKFTNGLSIYETIQGVKSEITTMGVGLVAGMACFVLVGGEITNRIALPTAYVMLREPSHSVVKNLQTTECLEEANLMISMYKVMLEAFSERTGQPPEIIDEDMKKTTLMTATEAYAYGIIDQIGYDFSYFNEKIRIAEIEKNRIEKNP